MHEKKNRPLVWAHRGASGYCPENTIPAFLKAAEQGADGVELDVQLTKDKVLVVCHDEEVDRTSNGSGWIKDMTLEELKALDFSNGDPSFAGVQIPTMAEVFEALADSDLDINIELKTGIIFYPGIVDQMLELTKEYGYEDRVIYSSFNHYTVKEIKAKDLSAKVGFLYADGTIDMPSYGKLHGVDALHPALYNIQFPHFMEECRANGLDVNVWTVNKEEYMAMSIQAGVDAIISNYPDKVFAVIHSMTGEGK